MYIHVYWEMLICYLMLTSSVKMSICHISCLYRYHISCQVMSNMACTLIHDIKLDIQYHVVMISCYHICHFRVYTMIWGYVTLMLCFATGWKRPNSSSAIRWIHSWDLKKYTQILQQMPSGFGRRVCIRRSFFFLMKKYASTRQYSRSLSMMYV